MRGEFAGHYISGEWIESTPQGTGPVHDPATGEEIGTYSLGSAELADKAIAAAKSAFHSTRWARSPRARAEVLLKFARNMEARRGELIQTVAYENGKILMQATMEVDICISEAKFYAGLTRSIFGRMAEIAPGNLSLLAKEPIGVAGIIVPWNAPATLLVRSLAPALAAGCTTVIKPAPQTPLINKCLIECLEGIDELPEGVINSVNENGSEVGRAIAASPDVDVISFTGSSQTGKAIMAASAHTLKRLSLELGGKAPTLVFPEANMDKAVQGITRGATIIAGQMCVAITRVLVHADCKNEFVDRFVAALEGLKVGPGYEPTSQMGPLIDKSNQSRVVDVIAQAEKTAKLLLKGNTQENEFPGGAFITPTIFETDDVSSPLIQEEHFAPVISLETFSSSDEAVKKANATRYGLAASVWTESVDRALAVSRRIEAGTVWVNSHNQLSPESETGGFKESGMGRLHGVEGLEDFLETKNVYFDFDIDR